MKSSMEPLPDEQSLRLMASQEAIDRLGLLNPDALSTVLELLHNPDGEHPRSVCAQYRKRGSQVTTEKKKAIGIRANAFMSKIALREISNKGLLDPIRAHEKTLLRASFTYFRYRNALAYEKLLGEHSSEFGDVLYDISHADACETCLDRDQRSVPKNWGVFAPANCTCETAPYGLRLDYDFISEQLAKEGSSKPHTLLKLIQSWFRRVLS